MASLSNPSGRVVTPWLRPAQRQALALLGGLVPGAAAAAFALAALAGEDAPQMAALATAALSLPAAALILTGLRAAYFPHHRLGAGNAVTILRGGALAAMAGMVTVAPWPDDPGWTLAGLAGGVLALDGVDGWAARRAGLASRFGARLDVETDVVFALVMAALAVALGKVGPWFLLIGLARPGFLLAGLLSPRLRAPLAPARRRRLVAGAQMGGQVVLLSPLAAPPLAPLAAAALLALVVWSFARDIRMLARGTR